MAHPQIHEGTPRELAPYLAQYPDRRFRLMELVEEPTKPEDETVDAKLHRWQQQDGIALLPDVSTQTLFAQWAEEDATMTEQEREAEDRLWHDIEKGLAENDGLRLRHLG